MKFTIYWREYGYGWEYTMSKYTSEYVLTESGHNQTLDETLSIE